MSQRRRATAIIDHFIASGKISAAERDKFIEQLLHALGGTGEHTPLFAARAD